MLCKLGWHTRSKLRARRDGGTWVSRCRRCDIPMRRSASGKWRVDLPNAAETETPE